MNHTRSPSFRRSPIQKPSESDSIKHKDKSSRQSFINHHGSLKADPTTSTKLLFDPIVDPRKLSSAHLTNGFLPTSNITKYRNIGKCSGLKLPSYGIAVWSNMSSKLTDEQSESIIKTAYENGFHYFDTGDAFNNGKSEQLLGNIIKKFNWERSSFIVSTKLFWNHPVEQNQNKNIALNRKYIIEAVKASLKRLKLDYIDLVIINRLDGFCPCEEIVRTMNILINNNLILYWGTSRWSHVHIGEAFQLSRQFNCFPPICEQMEYSPTKNREKFYHLLELYHKIGIGVISWSGNLLGADPGISLISRKSLEEYQNLLVAEESYSALSAAAQQQEKDRIEEKIITIPIKEKIKEVETTESTGGKLSMGLKKLSKKLSTPEKKKAEKNLSVNSAKTADCLSIDQISIDKRSSMSVTDQAVRLAELDEIINKLNINRSQFDAVYALRNEPVCSALIQPNSVKELNLYLDALKLEIPVNTLRDVDKIGSKFCKLPNLGCSNTEIAPIDTATVIEDEQTSNINS